MTLVPRLALAGALAVLLSATSSPAKPPAPQPAPAPPAETKSVPATPVVPDAPEPPSDSHRRHTHGGGDRGGYNEDVTIGPDEDYSGDVVCVMGHAKIEGHVSGSVTVVMGTLDVSGSVSGNVVSVMSPTKLASSTLIEGDLVHVGGSFERNGATVNGQVTKVPLPFLDGGLSGAGALGSSLLRGLFLWVKLLFLFLFFVCALLLAAIVPDRIKLISEEIPVRLFTAILAGLIGYMLFAMIELFLAVTIIGIPVAALLYLVFTVLKWLAMCGVFHQVGFRIGRAFGRDMSLVGALVLGWAPFALLRLVPCFGILLWFLIEIVAFGALILTRVGTRRSPPLVVVRPPAPPAAPPAIDPGVSPVV
ncbi:MAG TPA: hypothetical protein VFV19_11765 [Candidatus Polarisedimenticolaceae bacterium]|nr:hypothetical protein [Candidatus Polarisedimenticolaceae bacterium]